MVLDTSTSDLWFATPSTNCTLNTTSYIPTQPGDTPLTCDFPTDAYDPTKSPTYKPYGPDVVFNKSFQLGVVAGSAAYETVSVGGIELPNVTVGVAEVANFYQGFQGIIDGVFGLGGPQSASIFSSPGHEQMIYDPWFYKAVEGGCIQPAFSLAMDRTTDPNQQANGYIPRLGTLTFGGKPDNVRGGLTNKTVTVSYLGTNSTGGDHQTLPPVFPGPTLNASGEIQPGLYQVNVDSFNFPGSPSTGFQNAVVDSSYYGFAVPMEVAEAFNNATSPPGVFNTTLFGYEIDCNATTPALTVTIGGVEFDIDPRDLNFQQPAPNQPADDHTVTCVLGVTSYPGATSVLGLSFLFNVLAEFDVQSQEVTFTQRGQYSSQAV